MQSVNEKAMAFRKDIEKCIKDKHEDVITRFGALIAQGLIDAGGRNVVATMFSKTGAVKQGAAVGFLLFTQMWYWYPLLHGISLALMPTDLVGLNKNLKMPKKFTFECDVTGAKGGVSQAAFQYPKPEETKKEEDKDIKTTVLSTAKVGLKRSGTKGGMTLKHPRNSLSVVIRLIESIGLGEVVFF